MFSQRIGQNNGFTLAEIITVMIIVSVLASLALPRLTGSLERVRAAEGVEILTALLRAQEAYKLENGNYTATLSNLDVEITRAQYFVIPPTVAVNPVASITRIGGYRLSINQNGIISCVNVGAITCAKAGY